MTNEQKIEALSQLINAVIAVIAAHPLGMPGGELYARLMAQGITLERFEQLMTLAVESGKVEKLGQLYKVR